MPRLLLKIVLGNFHVFGHARRDITTQLKCRLEVLTSRLRGLGDYPEKGLGIAYGLNFTTEGKH